MNSKFINSLYSLINLSLEIPCRGENWKIFILLIRIISMIPSISDSFLKDIIEIINSKYISFDLFVQNCCSSNLQQLSFFMFLLSRIDLSKQKKYLGNKLFQILNSRNNDGHSEERIFSYILQNQIHDPVLMNPIFKPSDVCYKCSETGLKNNLEIGENWFSMVQFINDKIYLWSNLGLCIEFHRPFIHTFKNLKEEIIFQLQDETAIELINCNKFSDQFKKILKKIKYFYLVFDNSLIKDEFFTLCKKRQKISQSIGIISLNYLDFEEQEQDSDITNGGGVAVTADNDEIITSLPEVINDMVSKKINLNIPPSIQMISKPSTQLRTPDDSDQREKSDEWKINETPLETHWMGIQKQQYNNDDDDDDGDGDGDYITTSKNEPSNGQDQSSNKAGNMTDISKTIVSNNNTKVLPEDTDKFSLEITKCQTNTTNHKIQKDEKRVPEVNKKTEVINNNKKNISILNNIFKVDVKKPNKRLKNKVSKKKTTAPRQKKLSNVQQIITIPSQDVTTKVKKPTISIPSVEKEKYNGPVLRTRALNKRNEVPNSKETVSSKTPKKAITKKQKLINPTIESAMTTSESKDGIIIESTNNSVLNNNEVTKHDHTIDDKEKVHVLQESTTIVNMTPSNVLNAPTCNSSLLDAHDFTNELQAQINRSVAVFSNELTRKLQIINDEMNNRVLKDLSTKYQGLIEEVQTKFHSETERILQFVSNFQHLLLLPEDELRNSIRNSCGPSKEK